MADVYRPATSSRENGKASNAGFDAFVSDLAADAKKNKVPANLINSNGKIVKGLRTSCGTCLVEDGSRTASCGPSVYFIKN